MSWFPNMKKNYKVKTYQKVRTITGCKITVQMPPSNLIVVKTLSQQLHSHTQSGGIVSSQDRAEHSHSAGVACDKCFCYEIIKLYAWIWSINVKERKIYLTIISIGYIINANHRNLIYMYKVTTERITDKNVFKFWPFHRKAFFDKQVLSCAELCLI